MAEQDAPQPFAGNTQLDDAYLRGERPSVGGRGSTNKVPIVTAVAANEAGKPMRVHLTAVDRFTRKATANGPDAI